MELVSQTIHRMFGLDQSVMDEIDAGRLMVVSTLTVSPTDGVSLNHHQNPSSGMAIFSGKELEKINENEYYITEKGKRVARLVRGGADRGCDFIWYSSPEIGNSLAARLLVYGDPDVDVYQVNPSVLVNEYDTGEVVLDCTVTEVNGVPMMKARRNRSYLSPGFTAKLTGVNHEGKSRTSVELASDGVDYHGSSRPTGLYVICREVEGEARIIATDIIGNGDTLDDNGNPIGNVDFVLTDADLIEDNDEENFYLKIHSAGTGVGKDVIGIFSKPLKYMLPGSFYEPVNTNEA